MENRERKPRIIYTFFAKEGEGGKIAKSSIEDIKQDLETYSLSQRTMLVHELWRNRRMEVIYHLARNNNGIFANLFETEDAARALAIIPVFNKNPEDPNYGLFLKETFSTIYKAEHNLDIDVLLTEPVESEIFEKVWPITDRIDVLSETTKQYIANLRAGLN
ncbi:MAG TPA: hypothetical protein VLF89_07230 [Candidatus Saccharimonadales bacterium]|nr:hypothetical protein [Candidatus Saccharimonadales bacterium]